MKIIKVLFVFAIISLIAVSCKETKKEEVKDTIKVTEEVSIEPVDKKTESTDQSTQPKATEKKVETIETTTMGLDDAMVKGLVLEAMADTPVIYPGCEGSHEEIRACSIEKFKKFIVANFNKDLANDMDMKEGDHKIKAIVKISAAGKATAIKVDSPKKVLSNEIVRLIGKFPMLTAATKNGNPVDVYFVLPVNFKVED